MGVLNNELHNSDTHAVVDLVLMINVNHLLTLLLLTIGIGCQSNQEMASIDRGMEMDMVLEEEAEAASAPMADDSAPAIARKLIKQGHVSFETESIATTRQTLLQAVDRHQGYIAADRAYASPERTSHTLMIRVPAEHFDQLLQEAIAGVDQLDSREITISDVTEEFLDIQARLRTKKELEGRYRELLKQAVAVTEILEIEKQLGQLRTEIESVEGRMNYLKDQLALSTLTVVFYESHLAQTAFGRKMKDGFRSGWTNLMGFFILLINLWPFLLIVLALILSVQVYRKRKQRR